MIARKVLAATIVPIGALGNPELRHSESSVSLGKLEESGILDNCTVKADSVSSAKPIGKAVD